MSSPLCVYQLSGCLSYGFVSSRHQLWIVSSDLGPEFEKFPKRSKKINLEFDVARTCNVSVLRLGGTEFLVNKTACDILFPALKSCGRFMPAFMVDKPYDERPFWGFNCSVRYECCLPDQLEADILPYDKTTIGFVHRWAFDPAMVEKAPLIFKTRKSTGGVIKFCTNEFKDFVEKSGLVGFSFKKVWDSEQGGIWQDLEQFHFNLAHTLRL